MESFNAKIAIDVGCARLGLTQEELASRIGWTRQRLAGVRFKNRLLSKDLGLVAHALEVSMTEFVASGTRHGYAQDNNKKKREPSDRTTGIRIRSAVDGDGVQARTTD